MMSEDRKAKQILEARTEGKRRWRPKIVWEEGGKSTRSKENGKY